MNPGYAGRTELPDNLKVLLVLAAFRLLFFIDVQFGYSSFFRLFFYFDSELTWFVFRNKQALFRPVAMMVPNYALIAEISLYSFGYARARYLSTKMVATFTLSSEQLSSQDHYDYGMRAVKTTISQAGILKRQLPDLDEDILILRALCDVNIPKFLKDDLPLFEGIIADLFPGIKKPKSDFGALLNSISLSCTEMGLQPVPIFVGKVIQLYETTIVRHGLMVVGPTGAGKTCNWRCLKKAMTKLEDVPGWARVATMELNPKSITMGQLYGMNDEATKEWTDGILPMGLRSFLPPLDNTDFKKWIIFDGPVDAIWIENMNTVLDDNKKLCLNSGEIIALLPTMTMMFEVADLSVASPATVSRCGMVYMDPEALGISPPARSWLESFPANLVPLRKQLQALMDHALEPTMRFMRKYCAEPVPTVNSNLARSMMNIIDTFTARFIIVEGRVSAEEPPTEEELDGLIKHIEPVFWFALIWSVGASIDMTGRRKFDILVRNMMMQYGSKEIPPEDGLVYDFLYDIKAYKWVGWMTTIPEFSVDPRLSFSEIIVPTMDTVRYTFLLNELVKQQRHVLLTGDTGTFRFQHSYIL
jgi:dynein heavy chain